MLSVIKLVTDVLIKCAIGPHIVNYQERYLLVLAFIPIVKGHCYISSINGSDRILVCIGSYM